MNTRQTLTLIAAGLVLSSWAAVSNAMSRPQKYEVYQRAQTPANEEILTRGPVHEAFLAPVVYNPAPTVIVTHQPPEAITEVPPDQAPEAGAVWVPGYWAWDDDSTDFLWVSGCWRVPPSNSAWVPG